MQSRQSAFFIYYIAANYVQPAVPFLNVSLVAVGYIAPIGLSSFPYIGPAMSWGTEYVQKKYSGTLSFKLNFLYDPVRRTCPDMRDGVVDLISNWHYRKRKESDLIVYFIPTCIDNTAVPYFQKQWNALWFTTLWATPEIRDRRVNPTWIAVNHYSAPQCAELYFELFNRFHWTSIFLVIDMSSTTAPVYLGQSSRLIADLESQRKVAHVIRRITTTKDTPYRDFGPVLEDIRNISRVVLFFGNAAFLRELLITAAKMDMTNGEYVYIAMETMINYKILGKMHWQYDDENDQIAFRAFQSLLVIQERDLDLPPDKKVGPELIKRSARDYNLTYDQTEQYFPSFADNFLGILALAEILNETLVNQSIIDYHNGAALASLFLDRTFDYEYGSMYIDHTGERRGHFIVAFFDSLGFRKPFLSNHGKNISLTQIAHLTSWGNSLNPFPPPNEPFCGYSNNKPICAPKADTKLIVGFALLTVALIIVTLLAYRYTKLQIVKSSQDLLIDPAWWQIACDDLRAPSFWYSRGSSLYNGGIPYNEAVSHLSHSEGAVRLASYKKKAVICFMVARAKGWVTFGDLHSHGRLLKLLRMYYGLEHNNLCRFYGLSIERNGQDFSNFFVVFGCPARGCVSDLYDSQISTDFAFVSSLIVDFMQGLEYIHSSSFTFHGRISILNCWVDKHFTLKLMHLASDRIRTELQADGFCLNCLWPGTAKWEPFFWLAPEMAVVDGPYNVASTQATDVFSCGLVLYDILTRGLLYRRMQFLPVTDIAAYVTGTNVLVESVDLIETPRFASAIQSCLSSDPLVRPTIRNLRSNLAKASPLLTTETSQHKLFDKIYHRLCSYSEQLECEVKLRVKALNSEKRRCDNIIRQFLPREIVNKLRAGQHVAPEYFHCVTIMFTYLHGFSAFTRSNPPEIICEVMAQIEELLDSLAATFDVYKVEAVGDSFLTASGLPKRTGVEHVNRIALFSQKVMRAESTLGLLGEMRFQVGIHSGPCAAGVIGIRRPRYCLFGDTINVASRMCSLGMPARIHISSGAKLLLQEFAQHYIFEERGLLAVKGRDSMTTYWLHSDDN